MGTDSLGRILQSGGNNQIELLYDKVKASALGQPAGSGTYTLTPSVKADRPLLGLFDATLDLSASAQAAISIGDPALDVDLFDDDAAGDLQGKTWAALGLDGTLTIKTAKPPTAVGPLQLSGSVAAAADFDYRYVLPVDPAKPRLDALLIVASRTQLPQLATLTKLLPGEAMRLSGRFKLDLGLRAQYGRTFDPSIVLNAFDGLSTAIKAHVQASIEASLGWAVYETFDVAAGGPSPSYANPDWVRLRIARQNRNALTLGATFGLHVEYDAATALTAIFDRALEIAPIPSLLNVLREVNKEFEPLAAGDWEAVKARLTGVLDEAVTAYAGPAWKQWVAGSPQVAQFVAAANAIVNFYDKATGELDAKAKSIWEQLLLHVDLGPNSKARAVLGKIAAIDPDNIDVKQFLSPQWQDAIELIETLCGKDIEELVIGDPDQTRAAVAKAVKIAKRLNDLLTNAPDDFHAKVQAMLQHYGIESAVNWLKANATSKAQLEAAGLGWLRSLVEKLVGDAWAKIDDDDVKKVQAWAQKVSAILGAPQAAIGKMRAALASMKGDFGISIAFEINRVSESVAVLDVELDPREQHFCDEVAGRFRSGDVKAMLQSLLSVEPDKNQKLPYQIRECVFTTRQLRTSSTALFISWIGLSKHTESRIEEVTVEISGTGRTAKYLSGASHQFNKGAVKSEGSAYVRVDAESAVLQPDANYSAIAETLRLTFTRDDDETDEDEAQAINDLLTQLGFITATAPFVAPPPKSPSRLALEIALPASALDALTQGIPSPTSEDEWNRDARNAARRWFDDGFVGDTMPALGARRGEVLAEIVANPQFAATWTSLTAFTNGAGSTPYTFGKQKRQLVLVDHATGQLLVVYTPLRMMINSRPGRYSGFAGYNSARSATKNALSPRNLASLNRATARMFATGGEEWDVPLLNLWLVLARISRSNPAVLAQARGFATFRWPGEKGGPYDQLHSWMVNGMPTNLLQPGGVFPL